jgi:hypothetical protein
MMTGGCNSTMIGAVLQSTGAAARRVVLAALAAAAVAQPAAALEPLSQNTYVNDRLVQARVADLVRRGCPTISARLVRAFTQARALKRHALDEGYSEAQIEAFLDSDEDRQRIYARADRYMVENGVVNGQPETFCRLGRDEIARQTVAGSLLSAR